jgi:N-methylhydantoinase A/oxoprolinase/acetone carboxylase beta subunit
MSGEPVRLKDYENQAKAIIDRFYPGHFLGSVPVLLSHQVSSHDDYGVRTCTALLNAYCLAPLSESFYGLQEYLRTMEYKWPLQIVHSSGGSTRVAKTKAVQTLNSGSAAGVFGLERLATSLNLPDLLTVDIGGTSTEIGMISEHSIQYANPAVVDGMPLDSATPILSTLGVGGSTVAALGDDGEITLGPESVGVYPGPACYGLGGTHPTLTDAYLVMGYLRNDSYLGGKKRIHHDLAEKAFLSHLAGPLAIPVAEAANRVKQKAVEIIAGAMQALLVERNLVGENFGVAAIGGGGGCLAAGLVDHLGAAAAYLFRLGSVFGAFRSSGMDLLHEYEHKIDLVFAETSEGLEELCRQVNLNVKNLQRIAFKDMGGEGFQPEEVCFQLELEFVGDDCERSVRMPCESPFLWYDHHGPGISRFLARKTTPAAGEKELSKIRLRALVSVPHAASTPVGTQNEQLRSVDERQVYLGQGHRTKVEVFSWDDLPPAVSLDGPAIVESAEATIFLPVDRTITFDRYLTGIIRT